MLLKNLVNKISAQSTYNLAITNCCLLCLSPARSHYFGSKTISHLLHGWTAEILLLGCVSSSLNLVHFFVLFLSLHLISFSSKTSMLTLLFLCGYSFISINKAIYSVNAYVYILHNKTSEPLTLLLQHICHNIIRMYY